MTRSQEIGKGYSGPAADQPETTAREDQPPACGPTRFQDNGLRLEIRLKADAVFDAHGHLPVDEIEDQLYAHLGDEFGDVSIALIDEVIHAVMRENGCG